MHPTIFIATCVLTLLAQEVAHATPAPPAVRIEIEALFQKMQTSSCQFSRNGSWYSAQEARKHLLSKLDYLEGKDLIKKTEDFIALSATASSMSGKPYLVRCGATQAVESKVWLQDQLKLVRLGK